MATFTPSALNTICVFQPEDNDARLWLDKIERHGRVFGWSQEDMLAVAKLRLSPVALFFFFFFF